MGGGSIRPPVQQTSVGGFIRPPEQQTSMALGGSIGVPEQQVTVTYGGSIQPEQQAILTYDTAGQYQQTTATFGAAPSGSAQQGPFTYSSATGSGQVPSAGPNVMAYGAPPGGGANITYGAPPGAPPGPPGGAPPGWAPPGGSTLTYGAPPAGGKAGGKGSGCIRPGGPNVMAYGAPPGGPNVMYGAPPDGAPSGQGNIQVGPYAYRPPVPTYSTPRPDGGHVLALPTTTASTGVVPMQGPPQPQASEQGPQPHQPHLNLQAQGFLASMVVETENNTGSLMDPMAAFDLIDRNGDGVITRSEFEASVNAALPAD